MQAVIYARTKDISDKSQLSNSVKPPKIKDLPQFVKACLSEFWSKHPRVYDAFCRHMGIRIEALQLGDLDEEQYIQKWEELPK